MARLPVTAQACMPANTIRQIDFVRLPGKLQACTRANNIGTQQQLSVQRAGTYSTRRGDTRNAGVGKAKDCFTAGDGDPEAVSHYSTIVQYKCLYNPSLPLVLLPLFFGIPPQPLLPRVSS